MSRDSKYTATEIRQAGNDINWPNHTSNLVNRLDSVMPGGPWSPAAIRGAARHLGALSLVDALLSRLSSNRTDPQDEIVFKGSELTAAVGRVVQAFTLKDHLHPAMLDCDGLASQLTRDMINHREPEWKVGDIAETDSGIVYRYCGDGTWETFGTKIRYADDKIPRPLKPLRLRDERRGSSPVRCGQGVVGSRSGGDADV